LQTRKEKIVCIITIISHKWISRNSTVRIFIFMKHIITYFTDIVHKIRSSTMSWSVSSSPWNRKLSDAMSFMMKYDFSRRPKLQRIYCHVSHCKGTLGTSCTRFWPSYRHYLSSLYWFKGIEIIGKVKGII
jgi:hypothetical protein